MKTQAFKLKGRLYTFTVLQILNVDNDLFKKQLTEVIAQAPCLFNKTPLVLDLSEIDPKKIDLTFLCQCLREKKLLPVAVQTQHSSLATLAQAQGLAVLNASSNQDKTIAIETSLQDSFTQTEQVFAKSKLQTIPVRSGQQLVNKNGDLIVVASVSAGAELLSEGSIHVYGALRGRALAGIGGDKQARIFCHSLDAELVSIAGCYRLSDAIEPQPGPCQIYLKDEHIQVEPL